MSAEKTEADYIAELMAQLHPRARRREDVLAWYDAQTHRLKSVMPPIETLAARSDATWKEGIIAARALSLADLSPSDQRRAVTVLCDTLERRHATAGQRLGARLWNALQRSLLISAPIGLLLTILFVLSAGSDRFGNWLIMLLCLLPIGWFAISFLCLALAPFVFPFSITVDAAKTTRLRVAAAQALAGFRAPQSVETLAKATADNEPRVREAALHALRNTLPALLPAHYGQLGAETVPNLCRVVKQHSLQVTISEMVDEPLVGDLLRALEKVGDGRAVRCVEKVAVDGVTPSIRAEADRLLPILQERQRRETDQANLLRGASGPAVVPEQLLRPAVDNAQTTAPEQLLRYASGADAER